jgi:heat shock protein HtpX
MAQWTAIFGGGRHSDDEDSPSPISMMLMAIVAPLAALLVQMAVSRSREFQADATGAHLAGRTWGLSKALEKLEMGSRAVPMDASPATAHLFIVNPLSGRTLMKLFSTHPPMEERIARLRAMRLGG